MKFLLSTLLLLSTGFLANAQRTFDSLFIEQTLVVNFGSDESAIDTLEEGKLSEFLIELENLDTFKIDILAHTDNVGSDEYNRKLSKQRAQSVKAYLVDLAVDSNLIKTKFFGEKKPLLDNLDEESKAFNRRVELNLYSIKKLQWIHGQVLNDSTNLAIKATVLLHSKNHKDSTETDDEGKFRLSAPINEVVGLDIIGIDQLPITMMRKLTPETVRKPIVIKTEKIEFGKKFTLKRLHFYGNQSRLLPKSKPALKSLKQFMTYNKGTCIKIVGHVNVPKSKNVHKESKEFELSIARAMTIYDHLLNEVNIDSSRMSFLGKGNWEMLYPKAFKEIEQAKNRRVEVIIENCENTRTMPNDKLSGKYSFHSYENDKKDKSKDN